MSEVARKTLRQVRITLAPPLALLLLATAVPLQEVSGQRSPRAVKGVQPDDPTPVDVYRSYLNAIKKNSLVEARACWWLPGEDTAALDTIAGMWVAFHRFNTAIDKAGIEGEKFGGGFVRDDCTDAAINRTLERLEHSKVTVNGDTAKLVVRWDKDDGYPNPVFWFGDDPIPFRRTEQGWRIDALAVCGIEKPEELLAEGRWGVMFRSQTKMMNDVASGLELGRLKSAMDATRALEKHVGSLEGRIPLTRTVIYEEDTPVRYLQIRKGNPDVVAYSGAERSHRKDIDYVRRVEGDLQWVFTGMYGIDRPKIVVETSNRKGYEVIFDPDDEKAMEIVANQLGMTIGKDDREILALQITVDEGGHKLKQVEKPDTPQWNPAVTDNVRPLHGVTMDELVLFLESRFRRPVVNKTGLDGYYWLELSDKTLRLWPQKLDEVKPLDQTGLRLSWKRTMTTVLVVKDK